MRDVSKILLLLHNRISGLLKKREPVQDLVAEQNKLLDKRKNLVKTLEKKRAADKLILTEYEEKHNSGIFGAPQRLHGARDGYLTDIYGYQHENPVPTPTRDLDPRGSRGAINFVSGGSSSSTASGGSSRNPFASRHAPLERVKKDIAVEFYKLQSILNNLEFEELGPKAAVQAAEETMDSRLGGQSHVDLVRAHMEKAEPRERQALANEAFSSDISEITKVLSKKKIDMTVLSKSSFVTLPTIAPNWTLCVDEVTAFPHVKFGVQWY